MTLAKGEDFYMKTEQKSIAIDKDLRPAYYPGAYGNFAGGLITGMFISIDR